MPTAPTVLALEPLQPLPTRWEPQQSGNGRARGGTGCAAHVPRGSGCTRLEDASTRVESQKGLSSRTASTEGLSSFLRRLGWPWAGVYGCFWNPVPPGKAAKEKRAKEEKHSTQIYASQARRKELGSAAGQADAPCADTRGRRCPRGRPGQQREGRHARAVVCVDSFRHVIYNTLWTSNRLIKYIYINISPTVHAALLRSHRTSRPSSGGDVTLVLLPTHPEPAQEQGSCGAQLWKGR